MSNKKAYFFYQHVANEREKEQNKNTAESHQNALCEIWKYFDFHGYTFKA